MRHEDWLNATFTPEERAEIEADGQKLMALCDLANMVHALGPEAIAAIIADLADAKEIRRLCKDHYFSGDTP